MSENNEENDKNKEITSENVKSDDYESIIGHKRSRNDDDDDNKNNNTNIDTNANANAVDKDENNSKDNEKSEDSTKSSSDVRIENKIDNSKDTANDNNNTNNNSEVEKTDKVEGEGPSKILKSSFLQSTGSAMRETANSSSSWINATSSTSSQSSDTPNALLSSSSFSILNSSNGNDKGIFGMSTSFTGFSSQTTGASAFGSFSSTFGLSSSFGSNLAPAAPFGSTVSLTETKKENHKTSKTSNDKNNDDDNDSIDSNDEDDAENNENNNSDEDKSPNQTKSSSHATGEEDDENILQVKCKLFRLIKEEKRWQEIGTGQLRVNIVMKTDTETGNVNGMKIRLIMRREGVYKLLLNGYLLPDTPIELNGEKMLRLTTESHSDDYKGIGSFLFKFSRDSDCSETYSKLAELKEKIKS